MLLRNYWRLMVSLLLVLGSPGVLQAQAWEPLFPLPAASELPFIAEALRDPDLERQRLTDDIYAQRALEEQSAQLKELDLAQGNRRLDLMAEVYRSSAILAMFYEDIIGGRLSLQGEYGKAPEELVKTRRLIQRFGSEFARQTKDKNAQAHALYHASVARYLNAEGVGSDYLLKLQKRLKRPLAARVNYLIALGQGRNPDLKIKGQLQASLPLYSTMGRISAQLYLATVETQNSTAMARLDRAVGDSQGRSKADREKVSSYGLTIWRKKEGARIQWARSPLRLRQNQDLEISKAVQERAVLQASKGSNYAAAIRFYGSMADSSQGQPRIVPLMNRVLDLEAAQYRSSRSPLAYERALIKVQQILARPGILGEKRDQEAQNALAAVKQRHRNLVAQLIQSSKQRTASPANRRDTIRVAQTFLKGFALAEDRVPLKSEIANLYYMNEQHVEAVKVYVELKTETQGPASQQYLLLALRSQRILAGWPEKAPWQGIERQKVNYRRVLLAMYEERLQASGSWDDRAQVGLIYINLGQTPKAFEIWTAALQKDGQGSSAQLASGMMLNTYKVARQWQKLEDLSRNLLKLRVSPIYQNRVLDTRVFLADALFEGGKEHFAGKRYAEASQKLQEFVRLYKSEARRPEAMFVLGKSYHLDQKHAQSVETMYALVNEYPNSSFEHDALLFGGAWAKPMAWEDQTIYFYQRFADKFGKDPKAPGVRASLVELYMGRELYGNAVRAHAAQAEDPQVSRELRIKSALAVMHTEERYGEAKHAQWGANKAKELSGNSPAVIAEVLSFEARQAAASNKTARIIEIEAQLSNLGSRDRGAIEALALTRYILAEKQAELTKQEIFNLEQTNPYETLNAQFAIFNKAKAAYEKVCAPGPSSYCGLAMLRLSETTRDSLKSIENLTIAQTLDAATVAQFDKQKLAIITSITGTAARADAVALGISEQGETLPEWSKEIEVNSSEGSLNRSHGAIGNGYIQWLPVKADN